MLVQVFALFWIDQAVKGVESKWATDFVLLVALKDKTGSF